MNHTRFQFTIDKNQLNKLPVFVKNYSRRTGEQVEEQNVRLEFVPAKEATKIREYDNSVMMKIGFIAEPTTKEERDAGKKGAILGDAIIFESKVPQQTAGTPIINLDEDEAMTQEIPF